MKSFKTFLKESENDGIKAVEELQAFIKKNKARLRQRDKTWPLLTFDYSNGEERVTYKTLSKKARFEMMDLGYYQHLVYHIAMNRGNGITIFVGTAGTMQGNRIQKGIIEDTVYDYLVWEPEGELKTIADNIDKLKSKSNEVYRGISDAELKVLKKNGNVVSKGQGNTRDVEGSYVTDSVKLAGRFALVDFRDKGQGHILILDRNRMPKLTARDPGNHTVSQIPLTAVKKVVTLSKLK